MARSAPGSDRCTSDKGVAGFPDAWDVPWRSGVLSTFGQSILVFERPDYLFNVSFWRAIPYDPARPWREKSTGKWSQLLSMDACNETDHRNVKGKICPGGGRLVMWESPALRGDEADWKMVGDVWTDNTTVLSDGFLSHEFVTIDFLGSMPVPSDISAGSNGKSDKDGNTFTSSTMSEATGVEMAAAAGQPRTPC